MTPDEPLLAFGEDPPVPRPLLRDVSRVYVRARRRESVNERCVGVVSPTNATDLCICKPRVPPAPPTVSYRRGTKRLAGRIEVSELAVEALADG